MGADGGVLVAGAENEKKPSGTGVVFPALEEEEEAGVAAGLKPKNDLAGVMLEVRAAAGRDIGGAGAPEVVREMLGEGVLSFTDAPCMWDFSLRQPLCS